ncbi:MAG TPA: hypothetical protein PJ991_11465 [Kiritimatiellia bacterium]|nr:hypothetical protein [Kiritimatiellia bacterium]
MDYMSWNNAIGARFFNQDRAGSRVFLYVTTEVIVEVGAPFNADLSDFVAAVKTGHQEWITRHNQSICQQALQVMENWRTRGLEYPPYLAYLALFVLADTVEVEGFARFSYYPGLRQVLGEAPAAGGYPSFDKMYALWFDLEQWSNDDKGGSYGIFRADILGKREYVGLPKAQTILTDDERRKLPLLFAENGFDPNSPPSDRELSRLLSHEQHRYLMPRTKDILAQRTDGENAMREVLVDAILGELQDWNGSVPFRSDADEEGESAVGNLRLTMLLDNTARTARFGLRCRSNREYPEEGLQLSGGAIREPLICREDWQGWSLPLANSNHAGGIFDASRLDWGAGLSLADREHSWKATLSRRTVRVMVSAKSDGFDGFVEQSQLPQGKPFYLLAHEDHADVLQAWGHDSCECFSAIDLMAGLSAGWKLFSIARAKSDAGIRDAFPHLAFPTVLRILFLGGLRIKGNQYFTFALPQIEVVGAVEGVSVFCNDHPLDLDPETGLYSIPNALCARRLVVEVKRNGERIRSRSIYSIETVVWRDVGAGAGLDRFGRRATDATADRCVGPSVDGFNPPPFDPGSFLPSGAGHRVYFIGRNPGEIAMCPDEAIPDNWRPVWAVPMQGRHKCRVIYCGTNPSNELPGATGCNDRRRRVLWKEILHVRRKQIDSPSHPALARLWREYKGVAEHVR